jgi:Asp-tRNA(Asn)/Glu-tRNA(Gln) amidotransferase A subunit family amidase
MSVQSTFPASDRRRFLAICSMAGLGQTLLPGALFTLAAQSSSAGAQSSSDPKKPESVSTITPEMIDAAAAIAGITLTTEQKAMMLDGLVHQRESITAIRNLHLKNETAPAFVFNPVPAGMVLDTIRKPLKLSSTPDVSKLGASREETLAFATVRELAELVRSRKVSSLTLTKMYLERLKKYDPHLHFVITLLDDRALGQAASADREIAAGRYRGPLHGIPWGGKDLLSVKGYPTTWGAAGFERQILDTDATVVQRLDASGAVLLAKLSMGALAQGDLWFGGRTRNPWNMKQGSSGSSAGSGSATAAGCVGFAIGTETLGSISAPSTRCGVTGLRPSFGLVPRTGAMALSWSMDKIGPICRSVEDCALVLSAIYGPETGAGPHDLAVQPAAFNWDADFDWKSLRIGYIKSAFDKPVAPPNASEQQKASFARRLYDTRYNDAALDQLRSMGVTLLPVELPEFPFSDIVPVLEAEAAAAFDELTLTGRDKLLTGQQPSDWPNQFRVARFYSAVDYIQAMRARTLAVQSMTQLFSSVDVIVTPSSGAQLAATNLSGHPAVILPNGLRGEDAPLPPSEEDGSPQNTGGPGTPVSLTFLGRLYTDARLAAFARAYQEHTGFHHLHPKLG